MINKTIFRTYDIRGIADEDLTIETVTLIGQAVGTYAQQHGERTVITARDGRLSGPVLLKALQQGILNSGCDVIDIGAAPTPVLYFATHALHKPSGAMLTGSHNPPNYNGIKIVIAGEALAGEKIKALYHLINDHELMQGQGKLTVYSDILKDYVRCISSDIKLKRPLKIVIDCGNGIAGCVASTLYRTLGCEVIELFCEVDGRFPNHHPDPGHAENLQDLIQAVRTHQADIGLAFDGDADRLGMVSAQGKIIWPDRQLILFAQDILTRHPGCEIIYDVKCTRYVPALIQQWGGKPTICATGHSLVKAKLRETGAILAGEFSGHLFFKERWYGFDDGLYAGVRLLEILAKTSLSSDELFAEIPEGINTPELKIAVSEEKKFQIIERLVELADFAEGVVNTLDGLRVDFDNGFGLVRCSNTTPYLICRFEADDLETLEALQQAFKQRLLAVDAGLVIPF